MGTTGHIQSPRVWATGSIASATSQSNIIDLMGYRPAAIDFSSGWDAANRATFRVSHTGSSNASDWYDLYDSAGTEYQIASGVIASATSRSIVPLTDLTLALQSHRYLRLQSGPSSAVVNLTAGVTFNIQLMPV